MTKPIRTPKGVAIWPKLNEPDTKFNAAGQFHTKLALDADDPEVKAFIKALEDARDAKFDATVNELVEAKKGARAKELKKADVVKPEVDEETGEETGRLIISVKMSHKVTSKKSGKTFFLKPDYFTAKRVELKNPPRIGGGSVLRCFVELNPYLRDTDKTVGVSLRLHAVQIIKLVSGGSRSADDYGMDEEEGDDISDVAEVADTPAPADGGADDGDDDL